MKIWNKIVEIIKIISDNLISWLYDKPRDVYKSVRHWWRCNGKNPHHWKLVWYTMFHHYPWDNGFNYMVIQRCIMKSRYYFETHYYTSEEKRQEILKWQGIAIRLLDIITEQRKLWDWNYEWGYNCLVKVNTRNANRFAYQYTDYETGKIHRTTIGLLKEPHELYKSKALHLLTMILETYADDWWD